MKRVVFVGDVHVGSNYAVFPERFVNPESGNIIEANEFQKKLLDKWIEIAEEFSPVDVMIFTGDMIEGPQTKEKYGTLTLQNVQHQVQAFIELMKFWRWKRLYVVRGTPYHVEVQGVHAEEYIAKQLNAVKASKWGDRFSVMDLGIEIEKVAIHVAHHVNASAIPHYQFTPIVREGWLAKMYDRYHGHYDIIVRAHVHYCRLAQVSDDFLILSTPCWQLPTPYQKRKSHFVFPDLGILGADIKNNEYALFMKLIHDIKPHRISDEERNDEEKIIRAGD